MRLINPTVKVIHLRGNKVLAIVSQEEKANISTLDEPESSKSSQENSSNIPNSKFTFDLQNSDLSDLEKEKLLQFLNANSDIFSEG